MVRIAICDNNKTHINHLSKIVNSVSSNNKIKIEISYFNSGEDLISFCSEYHDYFDLIFLDIVMKGLNGIDTVKYIRNITSSVYIIFVTSSKNHALDSYSVNANGYILKPCSYSSIEDKLLDIYTNILLDKRNTIYVKNNHDIYSFKLSEIVYFESNLRKITAYLNNGKTLTFYNKMCDLEKEINDNTFVRCHRSFLVNLSYIKRIASPDLVTITDTTLPISKKYLSSTKNNFTKYIKSRLFC